MSQRISFSTFFEINKIRPHESIVIPEPQLEEQSRKEQEARVNDADDLSRTAGQLLDSVSNDTSDKFAQSSFLALMRKLRDREVKVEGENFIDVSLFRYYTSKTGNINNNFTVIN